MVVRPRQARPKRVRMAKKLKSDVTMNITAPTPSMSSTSISALVRDLMIPMRPMAVRHTPTMPDETESTVS